MNSPVPLITYPGGATTSHATVTAAMTSPTNELLFVVDKTPCHPENPKWPDQPADRCAVEVGGRMMPATCAEGHLARDQISLAQREDDTALPVVVHAVPLATLIDPLTVGQEVVLSVDEQYRTGVSLSHTRCHLAALALNHALATAWRKDPGIQDTLGHPDFDKLAISSSVMDDASSTDVYRIGKSLRKKGFAPETLDDLAGLTAAIDTTLERWLTSGLSVTVKPAECGLHDMRQWECNLPDGIATIPCGGTHVWHLTLADRFSLSLNWDDVAKNLTMITKSSPA